MTTTSERDDNLRVEALRQAICAQRPNDGPEEIAATALTFYRFLTTAVEAG